MSISCPFSLLCNSRRKCSSQVKFPIHVSIITRHPGSETMLVAIPNGTVISSIMRLQYTSVMFNQVTCSVSDSDTLTLLDIHLQTGHIEHTHPYTHFQS